MSNYQFRTGRDASLAGWWRRRRFRPLRHQLLMKSALAMLKLRYREYVMFYNKYGELQYLDLVIYTKRHGMIAILWKRKLYFKGLRRRSGLHPKQRVSRAHKLEHLEEKGIPYMWMAREHSSGEFYIFVSRWIHTLDKKNVVR